MKKIIALLLALIMCLSLCACGGGNETAETSPTPDPTPIPTLTPEELAAKYDADMAVAIENKTHVPLIAGKAVTYWNKYNGDSTYNTNLLPDEWIAETPEEVQFVVKCTESTKAVGMYIGSLGGSALQRYTKVEIVNSVSQITLASESFYGGEPPQTITRDEQRYGSYPDENEISQWIASALANISATQKESAVNVANSYLDSNGCSKSYLREVLTRQSGFTPEEAEYALNNISANWQKQALDYAKKLISDKEYYSRDGLFKVLTDERLFTEEDANYALDNCKADWNIQAIKLVKNLISNKDYSRDEMFKVLTDERLFTEEEANYALDHSGIDWFQMADNQVAELLKQADEKNYYSEAQIIDYLVSYKSFTEENAKSTVKSYNIDWNAQALKSADNLLNGKYGFGYSPDSLVTWMTESIEMGGEGFTKEQAQYAADNIKTDWNKQAEKAAGNWVEYWDESFYGELNEENLLWALTDIDGFTEEQAAHGMASVTLP